MGWLCERVPKSLACLAEAFRFTKELLSPPQIMALNEPLVAWVILPPQFYQISCTYRCLKAQNWILSLNFNQLHL